MLIHLCVRIEANVATHANRYEFPEHIAISDTESTAPSQVGCAQTRSSHRPKPHAPRVVNGKLNFERLLLNAYREQTSERAKTVVAKREARTASELAQAEYARLEEQEYEQM